MNCSILIVEDEPRLREVLCDYVRSKGERPAEAENGLQALVENIEDKENWQPSLQGSLPKDPWGNEYIYKCPGDENRPFEIISYGADGEPGGEDENADINSWE